MTLHPEITTSARMERASISEGRDNFAPEIAWFSRVERRDVSCGIHPRHGKNEL